MIEFLEDIENGQPCENTIDTLMKLQLKNLPIQNKMKLKKRNLYFFYTCRQKSSQLSTAIKKLL